MNEASKSGNWPQNMVDAMNATNGYGYNPKNGYWAMGDWHFLVTSNNPITVQDFKGSSEHHTFTSEINTTLPSNTIPFNAFGMPSPTNGGSVAQNPTQEVSNVITGTQSVLNQFQVSPLLLVGVLIGLLLLLSVVK